MPRITYDVDGAVVTRTITADQVTKLQQFVTTVNADPDLSFASVNEYLDTVFTAAVTGYLKRVDEITEQTVLAAYKAAPKATKNNVAALLGV